MAMKGVGAESGVKAEAIVFLNYSKDFSQTRQAGFVHLTKSRRLSPGGACGSKIPRRRARFCDKNPIFRASCGMSS
jgi:hypothetical protein